MKPHPEDEIVKAKMEFVKATPSGNLQVVYVTSRGLQITETLTAHKKCGDCLMCEIEKSGCGCNGATDFIGCFFCEPETYIRPPCPQ